MKKQKNSGDYNFSSVGGFKPHWIILETLMKKLLFVFLTITFMSGLMDCSLKKPTTFDRECCIHLLAIDTSGIVQPDPNSGLAFVAEAQVQLYSPEYNLEYTFLTDKKGELMIENLLASHYIISVNKRFSAEQMLNIVQLNKDVVLNGTLETDVFKNKISTINTIKLSMKILSTIVINEIYYCGSYSNKNYYEDQFIELYNASDSTQYLDRLIFAKATMRPDYMNQYAEAIYAYQFPGNGKEHPIEPGQYIVVAQDAINHITEAGAYNSLDLSQADFEFFNKCGDRDNLSVTNLENINPNYQRDFIMNLYKGGLYLVKIENISQLQFNSKGYILFNFSNVIDAVEYSRDPESEKYLDSRMDAGVAGVGLQKFSGNSIERVNPKTCTAGYDTNNSTFDFLIIHPPMPGCQHVSDLAGSIAVNLREKTVLYH